MTNDKTAGVTAEEKHGMPTLIAMARLTEIAEKEGLCPDGTPNANALKLLAEYAESYHLSKIQGAGLPDNLQVKEKFMELLNEGVPNTDKALTLWMRSEASKVIAQKDAEIQELRCKKDCYEDEISRFINEPFAPGNAIDKMLEIEKRVLRLIAVLQLMKSNP
jgi:hypothetical protein